MPIYLVKTPQGDRLVDAPTKAQAINHVTRTIVTADALTATQAVLAMQQGLTVEKAKGLPEAPPSNLNPPQ